MTFEAARVEKQEVAGNEYGCMSVPSLSDSMIKACWSPEYMPQPQCVFGTRAVMLKRPKELHHDQRTFSRAETQSHVSRSFRLSVHCQRAVKHSTALKNYRHAAVISTSLLLDC